MVDASVAEAIRFNRTKYCGNCDYFRSTGDGRGDCLRYPPAVVPGPIVNAAPVCFDVRPSVAVTEVCGEWRG